MCYNQYYVYIKNINLHFVSHHKFSLYFKVFRVPNIHCESENRVVPGAKSHFRVEYIGGPGKLCQEHGKITLTVDSTEQSTLFFSIAIWVNHIFLQNTIMPFYCAINIYLQQLFLRIRLPLKETSVPFSIPS